MSAHADGGSAESGKTEHPCVSTHTFYDAGSDYFMQGGIYWDSDANEWDAIHAPDDMSTSWELVDAPDEIQAKWNARQKAKSAAREKFKDLFESIKSGSECPVCGGEMHNVHNPPGPISDRKHLMYCGDCGTNTWYGEGMVGNFWVGIGNGLNWELGCWDNSFLLSDSIGRDCSVRKLRGPDYYGEKLKEYHQNLRDLKAELDV